MVPGDPNIIEVYDEDDLSGTDPSPIFIIGDVESKSTNFRPLRNDYYDLGSSTDQWQDLYLSGKLYVDGSSPANKYLGTDASGDLTYLDAPSGGGSPGGNTMQVQYNDDGSFGGASNLLYNAEDSTVGIGTFTSDDAKLVIQPTGNIDGIVIASGGDTGAEPDDGVDVSYPDGDCFVCNGSPVTLFRVSNNCEVFSHSYNQYIVNESGVGYIAQMSATVGRWLEYTGEAEVVGGKCRVDLPSDFLQSTTIDGENPIQVVITPYADLGNFWVERAGDHFVVHSERDGAFGFRVQAKIRGAEQDNSLVPVDLMDLIEDHSGEEKPAE